MNVLFSFIYIFIELLLHFMIYLFENWLSLPQGPSFSEEKRTLYQPRLYLDYLEI